MRALGEDGRGIAELEAALDPPARGAADLARAAVLASLANTLMRLGDDRAPDVGRTALAAARAAGAREQEASALLTLGSSLSYLADPRGGRGVPARRACGWPWTPHDHETALRGYVNLSDALEARGNHAEAATAAREGIELATRVGLSRSFGAFLAGNLMEPLVRLGDWPEAERVADEVMVGDLRGVFGATVQELLGYLAVKRGRLDAALQHVREARRQLGESREPQFTQALLYIEAEVARARGDLVDGRRAHRGAGWPRAPPGRRATRGRSSGSARGSPPTRPSAGGTGTSRRSSRSSRTCRAATWTATSGRRPRPPGPTGRSPTPRGCAGTARRPSPRGRPPSTPGPRRPMPGRWPTRGSGSARRCAVSRTGPRRPACSGRRPRPRSGWARSRCSRRCGRWPAGRGSRSTTPAAARRRPERRSG